MTESSDAGAELDPDTGDREAGDIPEAADSSPHRAADGVPREAPVWSAAVRLTLTFVLNIVAIMAAAAVGAWLGLSLAGCLAAAGLAGLVAAPILAYSFWSPIKATLRAVEDGLQSCRERD